MFSGFSLTGHIKIMAEPLIFVDVSPCFVVLFIFLCRHCDLIVTDTGLYDIVVLIIFY
jgi:hypothetical protein